jgi:hypothetical protein
MKTRWIVFQGSRVVLDHHSDEDDGQHRAGHEEDAVQLRDVVVVIDRLGGRLAGHGATRRGKANGEGRRTRLVPVFRLSPFAFAPFIC